MRRCGNNVQHASHGECDGRGVNEPLEGQLTVAELYRCLGEEQAGAMVCVELEVDGRKLTMPLAVPDPFRAKGKPLMILRPWRADQWPSP